MSVELRDHADGTESDVLHLNLPAGVDPADNELGWTDALGRLAVLVEDAPDSDSTHRDLP